MPKLLLEASATDFKAKTENIAACGVDAAQHANSADAAMRTFNFKFPEAPLGFHVGRYTWLTSPLSSHEIIASGFLSAQVCYTVSIHI